MGNKRKLVDFFDVNVTDKNNHNRNDHNNNCIEKVKGPQSVDHLIEDIDKNKPVRYDERLKLVGIYLELDVAKALDRLGKKGGKGAKSKIVNAALKQLFAKKGLI
ncbi:hypothetical protein MO973_25375 [Paenibacillus sp. TRM 82003]|nr:hypothetical protein [Paenibacillus sp. TRM 82003]